MIRSAIAFATPRLTAFILDAGECALRDAAKLDVPALLLVAGEDRLVDPQGAREFAAALPPGRGTLHCYAPLWHEVFNEREPDRSRVLGDLQDLDREPARIEERVIVARLPELRLGCGAKLRAAGRS